MRDRSDDLFFFTVELKLDSGETRMLKLGDVMIHRGTNHCWRNPSETVAARMLCFLLPAEKIEEGEEKK